MKVSMESVEHHMSSIQFLDDLGQFCMTLHDSEIYAKHKLVSKEEIILLTGARF